MPEIIQEKQRGHATLESVLVKEKMVITAKLDTFAKTFIYNIYRLEIIAT